jgi:hypothetical protein
VNVFVHNSKLCCFTILLHLYLKVDVLSVKNCTKYLWYVLNIGTITFYYIANLTCIATWPKYTIFGWGCHMELLPSYSLFKAQWVFRCPHWIGELSESFSKYFRFLARKLYVPPHSGLESAISITFIYLFIIDDKYFWLHIYLPNLPWKTPGVQWDSNPRFVANSANHWATII